MTHAPVRVGKLEGYTMSRNRLWNFVAGFALIASPSVTQAQCGSTFAELTQGVYGPGQQVTIDIGLLCYIPGTVFPPSCPACPGGRCDNGLTTETYARAYIVPRGSTNLTGARFRTVIQPSSTAPLISEVIANTAPLPNGLEDGLYDLIFDQCENGVFDAHQDSVVAQFEVRGATGAPPGTGLNPAVLQAAKDNARAQALHYAQALRAYAALQAGLGALEQLQTLIEILMNPAAGISGAIANWLADQSGLTYSAIAGQIQEFVFQQVFNSLAANIERYTQIAADPPDPNFQVTVRLGAITTVAYRGESELDKSCVDMANASSRQDAALASLLQCLEKFQGARDANNRLYAMKQARGVAKFAALAREMSVQTSSAATRFRAAIETIPEDLDAAGQRSLDLKNRMQSGGAGFNPDEQAFLDGLALTPEQRTMFITAINAQMPSATTRADLLGAANALATSASTNTTAMNALIAGATNEINALAPGVVYNIPIASAGGPYTASAGIQTTLTAAGTTDADTPFASLTFAWDLDEDGQFDDATGPTPQFTFNTPRLLGLVGVMVTDPQGNSDVAYATISIARTNAAPTVVPTPGENRVGGVRGETFPFSVMVTDPENDPTVTTWFVNNTQVATGTDSFAWITDGTTPIGMHRVRAVVTDMNPTTPDGLAEWLVYIGDIPRAVVSVPSIDFGRIDVGEFITQNFSITNGGTVALRLLSFARGPNTPTDFSIDSPTAEVVLQPGEMTPVVVRFAPTLRGLRSGTVQISTNDPTNAPATIRVRGVGGCPADLDDGSGTGTPDGGVTIDDLLYYLTIFEAGDTRADLDDGSMTATPDGGVTIDDLLYYLTRYEGGC